MAAVVGEALIEEGERTVKICYNLLHNIPNNMSSESKNAIRKQIFFLINQTRTRKIALNAGGYLDLNWGILGQIGASVATYLIVIIQFVFLRPG